jgi:hypothetical protein
VTAVNLTPAQPVTCEFHKPLRSITDAEAPNDRSDTSRLMS